MKTLKKSTNVKNQNKVQSLDSANVDQLANQIIEEKTEGKQKEEIKERLSVYKFDYQNLSTDQLKKKRQNARNKINSFCRNIINYSDLQKDSEKLKTEIENFKSFYKETYVINNFKVESLRKRIDEKERKDLQRMLDIIQEQMSENVNVKTEKKKTEKVK